MSFNRENVIWQSADGTWNVGFYEVVWQDRDGDPEWDVEYGSDFWWVSTGHPTEDKAHDAWGGANPGMWTVVRHTPDAASRCAHYDKMAEKVKEEGESWGRRVWASKTKHG